MTVYPGAIDSDSELIRIDDNLTEIGGQAINQLRDAVFAIESTLGVNPQGSVSSVANRLNTSLNADGTIRASALTSVGLATLPIVDAQVAYNAGIKETKLALDFSTSNLHTQLIANQTTLNSLAAFSASTNTNLLIHINGGTLLSDGLTPGRHVASHIDINAVPFDSRDPSFVWSGLKDKNGATRSATTVASALLQINDDLVSHENTTANAHPATAISVDTDNFTEIPVDANTVQKALDALDDSDRLQIGDHRATQHSNGIPKHARSEHISIDGYSQNIVPSTKVQAFLVNPPNTMPVDSNTEGDDLIKFIPDNTGFSFDAKFTQVKVGDIITINYGNGIVASFPVESIRFVPGSDWFIRINGSNLYNTDGYDAFARIDKPAFDQNTYGVLAAASANNDLGYSIMGSVIIGSPRSATALGIGFNADELDSTHYNLYLQFYPNGNPQDKIIVLPAIDVTGNAGITPGQYTIDSVVAATNDAFRSAGYNYRFIAFAHNGEFGIALADPIDGASFSIINGIISGTAIATGSFTNNVIGDATNGFDALGFGATKANLACPPFSTTFTSTNNAESFPTRIITPLRRRNFAANGTRRDSFAATFMANADGYWSAEITNRNNIGTTVEVTYTVPLDLCSAGLAPGKTIVVQPVVSFSDGLYQDSDYGRFIIKSVSFTEPCGPLSGTTVITVINGIHATGVPVSASSSPPLSVRLYFSEDSVGFNTANIIDAIPPATIYYRLHELYITESGATFSHERARMPKQAGGPAFGALETNNRWTVKNVSPKLRGFRDDGSPNLNKYIRFYVLSYDSTSGEYDGYIGKRGAGSNISRTGIITTGRKNVPSRFYDETNIDYIELEFFDETSSPGVNIMATDDPRYVDIEIFPTLETNDEDFLLATCEVDNLTVKAVTDRRAFGSISEKDLTQSAIDFITAGDRYLHENGVIRGMDFVSISAVDPRLLNFNGGLVLVNGNVVAVNNGQVSIPEVREVGATLPANVTWAVCINETGQYVPIILTTTKKQYFATTGTGDYYVPSVTFNELITKRKDLTIIAFITAIINSITLTVNDARKFINNETTNIPFTWVLDDSVVGQFKSFDALKIWINNYGALNNTVKVRGSQTINSALNFTFSNPVTFEGENATFNVVVGKGIELGSDNISIKKINFTYNPDGVTYISPVSPRVDGATVLDYVNANVSGGAACIYGSGNRTNIQIDECSFTCTLSTGPRPPFIYLALQKGSLVQRIYIRQNIFSDNSVTGKMAAISIINSNSGVSSSPADLRDCIIENNVTNRDQSIIITSMSNSSLDITTPGITVSNTFIRGNRCGNIGQVISSYDNNINHGLTIENNHCKYIANLDSLGNFKFSPASFSGTVGAITHDSADVAVRNNSCNWIHCASITTNYGNVSSGTLLIGDNKLKAYDDDYLLDLGASISGITLNNAILVYGKTVGTLDNGNSECRVINNTTDFGIDSTHFGGTKYTYSKCCEVNGSSTIINSNTFRGIKDDVAVSVMLNFNGARLIATNNRFEREANKVNHYISVSNVNATGLIVDNFFDGYTTDDVSNTADVIYLPGVKNIVAERNKNQTGTITLNTSQGNFSIFDGPGPFVVLSGDTTGYAVDGITALAAVGAPETLVISYTNASNIRTFLWDVSLDDVLPDGVEVIKSTLTASASPATASSSPISLIVGPGNGVGAVIDSTSINFQTPYIATTPLTATVLTDALGFRTGNGDNIRFVVWVTIEHVAIVTVTTSTPFATVTYRW
jgi:hypothetical protein